jgi:hypothetical protein
LEPEKETILADLMEETVEGALVDLMVGALVDLRVGALVDLIEEVLEVPETVAASAERKKRVNFILTRIESLLIC